MSGAVIGSLRAELSASIAQFQSDMGAAADTLHKFSTEAKKVGREIQEVGQSMSIALTLPLVALGTKAVEAANAGAQAMAVLNAAIASTGNASGKTAGQLEESANQLRSISTFSRADILRNVTSNLLTFGNVQGKVFTDAQTAIVNLTAKLGGDLQQQTIKVGRALQDPIKGVASLTRLGITFTSQQKDQIKALVQSGQGMKAQGIILDALNQKYGGAAQALRDATPGADLANVWEDFSENIGRKLIPALKDLATMLSGVLDWFNNLSSPLQNLVIGVAAFAAVIGPLLGGLGFLLKMGGQIAGLLSTIFTWVASLEVATLGWVVAIAAVGVALVVFWKSANDILHGDFSKAWDDAKDTATKIAGEIKGVWNSLTTPGKAPPGAKGVAGGAPAPPPQVFNQDNSGDLKKQAAALKAFQVSIQGMSDKINNTIGSITLPKATEQANALNAEIDAFVKRAQDAGVNTTAFASKIDVLRQKIEAMRQAGLEKEAQAFALAVDADAVAIDKFARGGLPALAEKLQSIEDQYQALKDKITDQIAANAVLADSNADAAAAMVKLKQDLADLEVAHGKATLAAKNQAAAEESLAHLQSVGSQNDIKNQIQDLRQSRGEGAPISTNAADLQATQRQLSASLVAAESAYYADVEKRNALVEQNLNHQNDQQIADLNDQIALERQYADLVGSTTADQIEAAKKVDDAFKSFADDLSTQLADTIESWNGSLSSLDSTFRKLAEQLFIKPATDSLTSSLSGGIKSLFQSGTGTGTGGGAGGFFSSIASLFTGGHAKGGSLNPGEWGIAGENGPEPIFGGSGGLSVMSNKDAGGLMGGRQQIVNQTWNVSTPDANSFRASSRQIARAAKQKLGMQG